MWNLKNVLSNISLHSAGTPYIIYVFDCCSYWSLFISDSYQCYFCSFSVSVAHVCRFLYILVHFLWSWLTSADFCIFWFTLSQGGLDQQIKKKNVYLYSHSVRVAQVCKAWNRIASDSSMFEHLDLSTGHILLTKKNLASLKRFLKHDISQCRHLSLFGQVEIGSSTIEVRLINILYYFTGNKS